MEKAPEVERRERYTPKILLVEDNPTDVFVIQRVLEEAAFAFDLHVAGNGQEALNYLQCLSADETLPCPDLVLLDLNLPRVAGFEVLREMRRGMRCGQCPVIVVSSSGTDADREESRNLGAAAYFQKRNDLSTFQELGHLVRATLAERSP